MSEPTILSTSSLASSSGFADYELELIFESKSFTWPEFSLDLIRLSSGDFSDGFGP